MWHDIRFAARALVRNPGITIVAILTLALGIGANTSIFSVVNAVLLRPLPYPDADRLVQVWETDRVDGGSSTISPANYLDLRADNRTLDAIAVYGYESFIVVGDGDPQRVVGAEVTPAFFDVLGTDAAIGRHFGSDDDRGPASVVLSDAFWHSRFAADPGVVGRTLVLSGRTYTVTGVMPPGFAFPRVNVWATMQDDLTTVHRGRHFLYGIARLADGATLAQASADIDAIAERLETDYPDTNRDVRVKLVPLRDEVTGDARTPLIALLVAVGFVLLIACVNVVNLLLTRASGRKREVAVRRALGANTGRLARQFLTEGLLLAACGGAAGLLLGVWGIDLLMLVTGSRLPRASEIRMDGAVFLFAFVILTVVALGIGAAQALALARSGEAGELRDRGTTGTARRARVRAGLAITQLALALPLLAGVALLLQTLVALERVPTGFTPDDVLTMNVSLPASKYPDAERQRLFVARATEGVSAVPGVVAAGMTSDLPFAGSRSTSTFSIVGRPDPDGPGPSADSRQVSPGYFEAMGLPVIRGRGIEARDDERGGRVVVVNRTLADRWFAGEEAIGQRLRIGGPEGTAEHEIVGIVADVRHDDLRATPEPEFYTSILQHPLTRLFLAVRARADAPALADAVRAAIRTVDPDQPAWSILTMRNRLEAAVAPERSTLLLLAIFAAVAFTLAIVGLYGVIAYGVAQRVREMGIRMALGAVTGDIARLVLRQAASIVGIGVVTGLAATLALGQLMRSMLFGIAPTDPATLAAVTGVIAIVAVAACLRPAWRATRVDPAGTMRVDG
ncbi:MAG: ABC transporter permease [Gemmatimonadota bacterium]|jgi:putative ABC transport system permease protein